MKNTTIKTFESKKELAFISAQFLVNLADKAIKTKGRFSVALSGGSTPKLLYESIVENFKTSVDWSKVDFFWSDERYVPLNHSDSNMKPAFDNLLNPLKIKQQNIHLIDTMLSDPAEAAKKYQDDILEYYNNGPQIDLILLGLGDDGHTASLFPGTKALEEKDKLVAANWVQKFQSWRVTFTFPLLNRAKNILFIASGENKADVVKDILENKNNSHPAARVLPENGDLFWYLDKEASSQLI